VRIASHVRSRDKGRHTTVDAHMTPAHRAVSGWNAPRILAWANKVGPETTAFIEHLMSSRQHPQQAYRACLGVLRLAREVGRTRLEAACARALAINARTYKSVASILKHGLERLSRTTGAIHACLRPRQCARFPLLPLTGVAMLIHPTTEKLNQLRLYGMAHALAEQRPASPRSGRWPSRNVSACSSIGR